MVASESITVESALAELREMFGKQKLFPPYLTAGFDPDKNWEPLVVIHIVVDGVGQHFKANTLTDCMAQVRKWREEQG